MDSNFIHFKEAFFKACSLDVRVMKPGNVSILSPGHGMKGVQFIDSVKVVTPILFDPNKTLGEKIEDSVLATFEVTGCNTNLGIVLLCAPIAHALMNQPKNLNEFKTNKSINLNNFHTNLKKILESTSIEDTKSVYRAIRRANPGGLGHNDIADVRSEPVISLLEAMRLSKKNDLIAKQYSNFFQDIFDHQIILTIDDKEKNQIIENVSSKEKLDEFVLQVYFSWLLMYQDSHILRKFGLETAKKIQIEAGYLLSLKNLYYGYKGKNSTHVILPSEKKLLNWDYSLKKRKINPGTSADLTVCILFIAYVFIPNLRYF